MNPAPASEIPAWRRFVTAFLGSGAVLGLGAVAFIAALDPYGLRVRPPAVPGPIMDRNQRFTYAQIARGGAFDAAVIGTSTARLLDPVDLGAAFGARFANLAVNAATPDEQARIARLFLRHHAARVLVFGLDATWCEARPPARGAHPFPDWLYEPGTPWGWLRQVNWQGLTVAARVGLHHLGGMEARARADGYAVFTPPEAAYDPHRARRHIHGGTTLDPEAGTAIPSDGDDDAMPALAGLDALLAEIAPGARTLVAFMPVHVVAQGAPDTPRGRREALCKDRVAEIGRRRGATVVDFRVPSPVTMRDENYWDALHYRLPVGKRIVAALKTAAETGSESADRFFRVLARP